MDTPPVSDAFDLDQNLRQFATERQWELLEAWAKYGGPYKAANRLEVDNKVVYNAHKRVLRKAARRGYSPQTPAFHIPGIPSGFVLRGQSALVNAAGELAQRWDKTTREGIDPDDARKLPDPKTVIKLSTLTDAEGRVTQQWIAEKPELVAREQAWRELAAELAQDIPRLEPVPPPIETAEDRLAGYPIGDHHLGMLSWRQETGGDYDLAIGERLLVGALKRLMDAVGPADQCLIGSLGDLQHYDSFKAVTPEHGNLLDADSRFPKVAWATVRVMRRAIDMARERHRLVRVILAPGNHDPASTVFLAMCLSVAYENEPRVTIDVSPSMYRYHRFGRVLIGLHHGHGAKMADLPGIMANDRPEDWGETLHRYWWTGHVHHARALAGQDRVGCKVESFAVLPPVDAYGAGLGHRPPRRMQAIVFHREHGEVDRHTVTPLMLESTA